MFVNMFHLLYVFDVSVVNVQIKLNHKYVLPNILLKQIFSLSY